jgi:hypothetical protein
MSGPSLEPDMIDTLSHPTPCNLIITISGDYRIEVRKGIVYPRMYTLDDVPIDSVSFDVVKVDMVHENAKNLNLEVAPDDTTLTLRDAVTRMVQWKRTSIDVDPAAILASTTPSLSQQHTILVAAAYHSKFVVAVEHSKSVTATNHSNYATAVDNSYSIAAGTSCADNS